MLGEIQLNAIHKIKLWLNHETGRVNYNAPKEKVSLLHEEVRERIHMIFSNSGLKVNLPRNGGRYGSCEHCQGPIDAHRAGTCWLCRIAFDKAQSLDIERNYVFVDTETTGRFPNKCGILELAMITTNQSGDVLDEYHVKVKLEPHRHLYMVDNEALRINHYNEFAWRNAVPLEACIEEACKRVRPQDVLVAWNAGFDASVLANNARLVCNESWRAGQRRFDAMSLGQNLKSRGIVASKKLSDVAAVLGIDQGTAHTAIDDTHTCRRIFFHPTMKQILFPSLAAVTTVQLAGSTVSTDVRASTPTADSGSASLDSERGSDGHENERQASSGTGGDHGSGRPNGYRRAPWETD